MKSITFHSKIARVRVHKEYLLDCMEIASQEIRRSVGQISAVLVRDREMALLHKTYSGIAGTTDVLTFDLSESRKLVEGDIYICLDQARRQAQEYGVPLYLELARLAAHGVLHLAGYTDKDEKQRNRMRLMEDQVLELARRQK